MKPDWDDLGETFENSKKVLIGDVDCTVEGNKQLCEEQGATCMDDIIEANLVDDFITAIQLKPIHAGKLRAALKPAALYRGLRTTAEEAIKAQASPHHQAPVVVPHTLPAPPPAPFADPALEDEDEEETTISPPVQHDAPIPMIEF